MAYAPIVPSANRTRFSTAAQSAFGTANTTFQTWANIRSANFKPVTAQVKSQILRSDRMTNLPALDSIHVQGQIGFELAFTTTTGASGVVLAAMMGTTWSAALTQVTGATTAGGDKVVTKTSAFGSWAAGDIVRLASATVPTINGFYRLTAATANTVTVEHSATLAAASDVVVDRGDRLTNGTTMTPFTCEIGALDVGLYEQALDCFPDTLALQFGIGEGMTNGTLSFMGSTFSTSGSAFGSGYTADPVGQSMQNVNGLPVFRIGDTLYPFRRAGLSLTNNMQYALVANASGPIDIPAGEFDASGSFEAYFSSTAHLAKVLADTSTSLMVVTRDTSGNAYVFDLPRIKLTAFDPAIPGPNTQHMQTLQLASGMHETLNYRARIYRFVA